MTVPKELKRDASPGTLLRALWSFRHMVRAEKSLNVQTANAGRNFDVRAELRRMPLKPAEYLLGVGAGGQFGCQTPFQVAAFPMLAAPNDNRVKGNACKTAVVAEPA